MKNSLRDVDVGPRTAHTLTEWLNELADYTDTLLGRKQPPFNRGTSTLMEYADAVYARAQEIAMQIHRMEREGRVKRGDQVYLFRTGELRDFIELAHSATKVGSRRITMAQLAHEQERLGREAT